MVLLRSRSVLQTLSRKFLVLETLQELNSQVFFANQVKIMPYPRQMWPHQAGFL